MQYDIEKIVITPNTQRKRTTLTINNALAIKINELDFKIKTKKNNKYVWTIIPKLSVLKLDIYYRNK